MKHKTRVLPLLIVMMVFMAVFLSACGSDSGNNSETAWEADPNIEIVRDFFVYQTPTDESKLKNDKYYQRGKHYYLLRNNYDKDIRIEFNTTVYNEKHREIESAKGQNLCIGAGQYGIVAETYHSKKIYGNADYKYTYKVSDVIRGTYSETSKLKYEYAINDKDITVAVTNTSEDDVLASMDIIFFKDGEPIDCRSINANNDHINTTLLSGTTNYSTAHWGDIDFDSVEFYPEASVYSNGYEIEVIAGEKVFDYIEIKDEYFAGDNYCYIIHNKSDSTLMISANGIFKSKDGELLNAYKAGEEYAGAGEDICLTSIAGNYGSSDNGIKPETQFIVSKSNKQVDLTNIELSYRIADTNPMSCRITAKNNSSQNVKFLSARVVFLKDGVPVYTDMTYFHDTDDDINCIFSAGNTSEEVPVYSYEDFDDVRIYLSAKPA